MIKLPKELKMKHFDAIDMLAKQKEIDKVKFLTAFFGKEHKKTFESGIAEDVNAAFERVVDRVNKDLQTTHVKLPKRINLGGTDFYLLDLKRPTTGWMIDSVEVMKTPDRLVEMCYCPEGSYYGETDETSFLLNPLGKYTDAIREEFPLRYYKPLADFFLNAQILSVEKSLAKQRGEEWARKMLSHLKLGKAG